MRIVLTVIQSLLIVLYTVVLGTLAIVFSLIFSDPDQKDRLYLFFAKLYSWLILKTCFVTVECRGAEKVDPERPYVFMSNHVSYFDIPAIIVCLPHPLRWVYKKELGKIPVFGWALKTMGQIMVDRSNRASAVESLTRALSALGKRSSIMICPEGTRSRTGELLPFKKGGFYTAVQSGYPVVPVAVKGTRDIMRKGSLVIHPGRVEVIVCDPIEVKKGDYSRIPELMEKVRGEIEKALSGESIDRGEVFSEN